MKVSLNWLKRYVDIAVPLDELCRRMVLSGFEVDGIEDQAAAMHDVVTGRITELEKHPDADRLQICQLDVGTGDAVQIVTGADNVFVGAVVPVALPGSHLPCGMDIKKGKLRGVPSNGMLCSGEELCLREEDYPGAGVHGILILNDSLAVGVDMRQVLHRDDVIIDFDVTANRPDCQSVLGIAREVAAVLDVPFKAPQPQYTTKGGNIHEHIRVTVQAPDLCPRYLGRVVINVRPAPSPAWMQTCLRAAGMRPISNIVDITNFVMLETGQPMHAFDLRDVKGQEIVVRRARPGESMTTLDGKEHVLTEDMLVIADAQAPSCLAGVMGGLNSEIKPDTPAIFLEAAKFRRDSVRRTARALGMRTESSARFEKGVDVGGVAYAMDRALQLIEELDAADIVDGVIDCHQELPEPRVLRVTPADINALLGLHIPAETMVSLLRRLSLPATLKDDQIVCTIPSFRDDIEGRADLAEEIMRLYGYEHLEGAPMQGAIRRGRKLPDRLCADRIKARLIAAGAREITTYSFISAKAPDLLDLAGDDARRQAIPLRNPLGEEYAVMRTQLTSSMLTVLATNLHRKNAAVRLFEVGKQFMASSLPLIEQPEERPALCLGLYGDTEDFFTLKGLVEAVYASCGLTPEYVPSNEPYLHPGRQATVVLRGGPVGVLGEVHPDTATRYDVEDTRLYVAELDLRPLYVVQQPPVTYRPLPRFPAVERDLALLCDDALPAAVMEKTIRAAGGSLLESVTLFDVYRGTPIPAGQKSVAWRLQFRSAEGTLTDQQTEAALKKIIRKLQEKGCFLRT